jgi:alkyl hydroperoxide reductase subunit AhpC
VAQLCQQKPQFQELNTTVLVISFDDSFFAQQWLAETDECFQLLVDPEREVYQAYGLQKSLWHSWNVKTVVRYVQLMRDGQPWRGIQGDSTQLGGDFLIDAQGVLRLAYRSQDPTDRPSITTLLDTLRQLTGQS